MSVNSDRLNLSRLWDYLPYFNGKTPQSGNTAQEIILNLSRNTTQEITLKEKEIVLIENKKETSFIETMESNKDNSPSQIGWRDSVIKFFPLSKKSQHSADGTTIMQLEKFPQDDVLTVITNANMSFNVFCSAVPQTNNSYWLLTAEGPLRIDKEGKTAPMLYRIGEENVYENYSNENILVTSYSKYLSYRGIAKWNIDNPQQPEKLFSQNHFVDLLFIKDTSKFLAFYVSPEDKHFSLQLWNLETQQLEWERINDEKDPWFKNDPSIISFHFVESRMCPIPDTVVGFDSQAVYFINHQSGDIKYVKVAGPQDDRYINLALFHCLDQNNFVCRALDSDRLKVYSVMGDLLRTLQVGLNRRHDSDGCPVLIHENDQIAIALIPGNDHQIGYWNLLTGEVEELPAVDKYISQLYFSPSKNRIIGLHFPDSTDLSDGKVIYIWDYANKKLIKTIEFKSGDHNNQLLHLSENIMILGTANFNFYPPLKSFNKSKSSPPMDKNELNELSQSSEEFSIPLQFKLNSNQEDFIVSFHIWNLDSVQEIAEIKEKFYPAENWFYMNISLVLQRTSSGISLEAWQDNNENVILTKKLLLKTNG